METVPRQAMYQGLAWAFKPWHREGEWPDLGEFDIFKEARVKFPSPGYLGVSPLLSSHSGDDSRCQNPYPGGGLQSQIPVVCHFPHPGA